MWPRGVAYEDGRTGARVQARLGRRGVVVTALVVSTKLLYIEPG